MHKLFLNCETTARLGVYFLFTYRPRLVSGMRLLLAVLSFAQWPSASSTALALAGLASGVPSPTRASLLALPFLFTLGSPGQPTTLVPAPRGDFVDAALACPRCGRVGDAKSNCCSSGGAWEGMCGEGGQQTHHDGYQACNGNPDTTPRCFQAGGSYEAIAVTGHTDGFGACYLADIRAFALSRYECKHYKFIPFATVAHGQNASRMNIFSGLRSDPEVNDNTSVHVYNANIGPWATAAPYFTRPVRAELLAMYLSTPKPSSCPYDLAIHIRRGDVNPSMPDRFVDMSLYVQVVTDWLAHEPDARIGIYSEGSPGDFSALSGISSHVHLVLNGDIEVAFHHFVTARHLAVAPSSFSIGAGQISPNHVFYLDQGKGFHARAAWLNGDVIRVPTQSNTPAWPADFRWK